ncbi:NHLP leader peptide family RiPP precursor [uncultured Kordia sp.]|uniref:NHLP leader peptide family RiPP precursor n=1 Tax=uncultured Kordia sp. TaxID=507699 RepID=UPI002612521D|nr:NHLP leader peptide family RiPP precursor [uncultured Kordia sp.]
MKVTKQDVDKGLELHQQLVSKAWESAAFKEQLINNPKAVIAEMIGKTDTELNATVVVEDQTDANTIYLNIPAKPNFDNLELELTEEELEMVSGGDLSCSVVDFFDGVGYTIGAGLGMLIHDTGEAIGNLFD